MVSEKIVKLFVVFLVAYLLSSMALFFAGLIDTVVFWGSILLAAAFAFFLLPRINK